MSTEQAGRLGALAGLSRVTVSAPRRRVDIALPEHVPVVQLLPEVLRHAGESLADDGERHGGWVLRRADGGALAATQGLLAQGIRDGAVLYLVPAQAEWPEPEYDDVVEAIAEGARRRGAAWSPPATRSATLVAGGLLAATGVFAILRAGSTWPGAGFVGLGLAVLLALASVLASRAYGDGLVAAALGGFAAPYAFVGGALAVASARPGGGLDPAGVLGPVRWLGASQLLVGSVAVLLISVFAGVGAAVGPQVFAAGTTVGLFGALSALLAYPLTAAGAAAVLISVLVCGIGVVPLLAIRFGKVPMPPVALPTGEAAGAFATGTGGSPEPVRERPGRGGVFAAVARTEQLLTGMLAGHAVLCAVASTVLVADGGLAAALLVAVAAVALLLRSRLFVTARQRIPLLVAGLAVAGVLAAGVVLRSSGPWSVGIAIAGLVVALVVVAAGATYSRRPPSPYLGRAADLVDTLAVVSVVPVACAVLGLYARMRSLAS